MAVATPAKPSVIPSAMMAAGIALLCLWLLIRLRRRGREIARRSEARQESLRPSGSRVSLPSNGLDDAMVRIQELTRECAAQIDNRIERLEHVLRLVDQRIHDLEGRATSMSEGPIPFNPPRSGIPQQEFTLQRPEPETVAQRPAPAASLDPLTRRVHELADRGRGPIEIAQQLNEPTGKIELILALRHASAS
ncbi:MAG: hypothetical protein KDA21_11455 [Phycisphaerales bacterium]|nr:hypothetical protein [Phycisphaerales bacterium]